MNKRKIVSYAIPVLAAIIMLSVCFVLVNEIDRLMPVPDGPFIVLDKKVEDYHPYPLFFITEKKYLFQFNATFGDYGWLEVPDFAYKNYTIGDLYPNTWVICH